MAVECKYERDIDILLTEEFAVSPPFSARFLEHSKNSAGTEANVLEVYVSRSDATGASDLVEVAGFKVSAPDATALSNVRAGFEACVRLIRFYRQHREILDRAASESLPDPAPTI